jgi:hypothetical protein
VSRLEEAAVGVVFCGPNFELDPTSMLAVMLAPPETFLDGETSSAAAVRDARGVVLALYYEVQRARRAS